MPAKFDVKSTSHRSPIGRGASQNDGRENRGRLSMARRVRRLSAARIQTALHLRQVSAVRQDEGRESSNVEDRRDQLASASGRSGLPLVGGKLGIGSIAIALWAAYFLGVNPLTVLSLLSGGVAVARP